MEACQISAEGGGGESKREEEEGVKGDGEGGRDRVSGYSAGNE